MSNAIPLGDMIVILEQALARHRIYEYDLLVDPDLNTNVVSMQFVVEESVSLQLMQQPFSFVQSSCCPGVMFSL